MATWYETASDATDPQPDPKPLPRLRDPEVFKRFHEQGSGCLVCGTGYTVQAHHLLSRGQGGDDVLENLVPLCAYHHGRFHQMNNRTVRNTIGRYIISERGAEALLYLRSKRSDGWIEKRFGVELCVD